MPVTIRGSGQVPVQVIQTIKGDVFSSNSQTFVDITGMSVSITPTSSSNKILVMYSVNTSLVNGGYVCLLKLLRNGTDIALGTPSGNVVGTTTSAYSTNSSGEYANYNQNMTFIDSPATTSAVTYKLQARGWISSLGTFYINQSAAENNTANFGRTLSTITVMEISG